MEPDRSVRSLPYSVEILLQNYWKFFIESSLLLFMWFVPRLLNKTWLFEKCAITDVCAVFWITALSMSWTQLRRTYLHLQNFILTFCMTLEKFVTLCLALISGTMRLSSGLGTRQRARKVGHTLETALNFLMNRK